MSGICYNVDPFYDDYCRICHISNETQNPWKEVDNYEYLTHKDWGWYCEAYYRCCQSSSGNNTHFWSVPEGHAVDEVYVFLRGAAGALPILVFCLVLNLKQRALYQKFRQQSVRIQATITERLADPIAMDSHYDPESRADLETHYYREAERVLEFTNTDGDTVRREHSLNQGTVLAGDPLEIAEVTIYHLPDHPRSALREEKIPHPSSWLGLSWSLFWSVFLVWYLVYSYTRVIEEHYAPVWYGWAKQLVYLLVASPLLVGLPWCFAARVARTSEDRALGRTITNETSS